MTPRALVGWLLLDAAATALAFPIYAFVRWVVVWDASQPREAVITHFTAGFPGFMADPHAITVWSAGACGLTVVLAFGARRLLDHGWPRRLAAALLGVAAVLGAWNLFTMM